MAIGLWAFVFLSAFFQVSDVDVGYHMRTAAYILANHSIPTTNTFSATTPNEPWLLHQWLGTLFFYLPFKLGGVDALITVKALVAVVLMFFVWSRAKLETGTRSWWPFWATTAGVLVCRIRFFERSDFLSAVYLAALLYADGRWNRNRRWQWIGLPLFFVLWANTHAGVIYGFVYLVGLMGIEWLEWFQKRWLPALPLPETTVASDEESNFFFVRPIGFLLSLVAACVSVQLINPNGLKVLWFPISQFGSHFWQQVILEYHPPTWANSKIFYLFVGALVVLQLLTLKRFHLRSFLLAAAYGYLACSSQRSILFFTVVAVPYLARMLELLMPTADRHQPAKESAPADDGDNARLSVRQSLRTGAFVHPLLLPAVWILAVALIFIPDQTFRFGTGWYAPYYPLRIYRFIQSEVPPQNIFNEMRYGGSMLWWLYPKFRPFVDGRGDAYSEQFWQEAYIPVLKMKPGWTSIFKHYDVHAVLLPIDEPGKVSPLAQTLFTDPHWALVRFNDDALFFLEQTETNREVIARNQFKWLWPGDWSFDSLNRADTRAEATQEARRAFENEPDSRFARTAMVRVFMNSGQFTEAANLLAIIVRENDAGETYWRDYGYALFRLNRLDDADQVFSRMIRKNQMIGFANYMKYYIAVQQKDTAAAQEFLTRALAIEPNNPAYLAARTNLTRERNANPQP